MWFKYALIVAILYSTLCTIKDTGKPITAGPIDVAIVTFLNAAIIAGLLYYWR